MPSQKVWKTILKLITKGQYGGGGWGMDRGLMGIEAPMEEGAVRMGNSTNH